MKKLIALVVAMLMLALPIASAETVISFANPVLTVDMGEQMKIDLTGLELDVAFGTVGEIPAIQIDIKGDGQKLYGISANIQGDKFVLTGDGLSNAYYVQIPAAATNLQNLQLPQIDTEAIMGKLMGSIQMDGNTIKIPYTAVNDVLAELAPALQSVDIPGFDASQITSAIDQLKQSNTGVNLEVTMDQSNDGMDLLIKAFPVENGNASDEALLVIDATYGETDAGLSLNAKVSAAQNPGEAAVQVFEMSFTQGDATVLDIDVMGQASFHFSLEGKLMTLALNAAGQGGFELKGEIDAAEADVEFVEINAANAINVESITEEQSQALLGELMGAASGLIGYLTSALGAAA